MAKSTLKNGILDLFCGPGGLSLGFALEGFETIYSNDIDSSAIETISHNHKKISDAKGKKHIHVAEAEDINKLSSSKIKKIFKERGCRVQGIIGGPPCQGFSVNAPIRSLDDDRNHLSRRCRADVHFRPTRDLGHHC